MAWLQTVKLNMQQFHPKRYDSNNQLWGRKILFHSFQEFPLALKQKQRNKTKISEFYIDLEARNI